MTLVYSCGILQHWKVYNHSNEPLLHDLCNAKTPLLLGKQVLFIYFFPVHVNGSVAGRCTLHATGDHSVTSGCVSPKYGLLFNLAETDGAAKLVFGQTWFGVPSVGKMALSDCEG